MYLENINDEINISIANYEDDQGEENCDQDDLSRMQETARDFVQKKDEFLSAVKKIDSDSGLENSATLVTNCISILEEYLSEKFDYESDVCNSKVIIANSDEMIDTTKKDIGNADDYVKSLENHHYLSNKHRTLTPRYEKIIRRYGLDLADDWNVDLLPHQGRHANEYHDYMFDNLYKIDDAADGNKDIFLELLDELKSDIKNNPDMLYKDYWRS